MKNKYFIFLLLVCISFFSFTSTFDCIYKYGIYKKGWAMVENDMKFGFIDMDGDIVVPVKYDCIYKFNKYNKGWAMVENNMKFGFIDMDGYEVVTPKYDNISKFDKKSGLAQAEIDGKAVLIDKDVVTDDKGKIINQK